MDLAQVNPRLVAEKGIAVRTLSSGRLSTNVRFSNPEIRISSSKVLPSLPTFQLVKSSSAIFASLPDFVEPMKAKLVDSMPSGNWIYEIKFDGYRGLAMRGGSETRVLSRKQKDLVGKFPEVKDSIAALDVQDAIIDGEIVALDEKGRSSFQLLQSFNMGEERPPIVFYAFDLLRLNGKDLQSSPIEERKAKLEELLKKPPGVIRSLSQKTLKGGFQRRGSCRPKNLVDVRTDIMTENVILAVEFAIIPGRFEDFKTLMAAMVDATQKNEFGTLNYEWAISDDRQVCHVYERFRDSDAVMTHMERFNANFAAQFSETVKLVRFVVYGTPSAHVKEALAGASPVYMAPFGGFSR
jgi:quinol monooxygenase YgiN